MRRLALGCWFFLGILGALGASPGPQSRFLDPSGGLKASELADQPSRFAAEPRTSFSLGFVRGAFWLRWPLTPGDSPGPLRLTYFPTQTDKIDAFLFDTGNNLVRHLAGGDSRRADPGPQAWAFAVDVPPDFGGTLLLRLEGENSLQVETAWGPRDDAEFEVLKRLLFPEVVLGVLGLMLMHSLFLAWRTRDKVYRAYAVYVASAAFYFLYQSGLLRVLVLASGLDWPGVNNAAEGWALVLPLVTAPLFTIYFTDSEGQKEVWAAFVTLVGLAAVGWGAWAWGLRTGALAYLSALNLVVVVSIYALSFHALRRRRIATLWLLAAWMVFSLALFPLFLATFGVGFTLGQSITISSVGTLLEFLILNLALAVRVGRLKDQVIGLIAALEQRNRLATLGILTARLGHEVGNVLHVARLTLAEWEARGEARDRDERILAEDQGRAVGRPDEAGDRRELTRSLGQLLGQARELLDRGRGQVFPRNDPHDLVDLKAFLDGFLERQAPWIRSRTNAFRRQDGAGPLVVSATEALLEHVLANLVKNALESLEHPSQGVVVRADREGPWAVVRVIDEGRGMDSAALARAREPFSTSKAETGHWGLGLDVVRQAADLLGGQFDLESAPGVGTTATLRLPASGSGGT